MKVMLLDQPFNVKTASPPLSKNKGKFENFSFEILLKCIPSYCPGEWSEQATKTELEEICIPVI